MLYIHQSICISPQQTFGEVDLTVLHLPADNTLNAIEPAYGGIPPGVLRRMSKSVRIGVGAALPLLNEFTLPDGIIIGTANAGMEDCIYFLKQIVDYDEGLLSPGSFVQSTPNALAAQLGMLGHITGYNITHVHHGHAFENALADAGMLVNEHPGNTYLLGAVDDVSAYNYTINSLQGWFKNESFAMEELYRLNTPGSIAGEGAAMFLVNGNPASATAQVKASHTVHTGEMTEMENHLKYFLDNNLERGEKIDLVISGENGDNRLSGYYACCENMLPVDAPVVRFKHLCGEYPTATAFGLWLACYILQKKPVPPHMIKKGRLGTECKNLLIYNNYKEMQHSFILVKGCPGMSFS